MTGADVWNAPAEKTAASIDQERVLELDQALSGVSMDFLHFQQAREDDDRAAALAAINRLATKLSTAAPLARIIQRTVTRSPSPTKE